MEREDPSMQDSPRLAPVLPVQKSADTVTSDKTHRTDTSTHLTFTIVVLSPDLFSIFSHFSLVENPCFLQQVSL